MRNGVVARSARRHVMNAVSRPASAAPSGALPVQRPPDHNVSTRVSASGCQVTRRSECEVGKNSRLRETTARGVIRTPDRSLMV